MCDGAQGKVWLYILVDMEISIFQFSNSVAVGYDEGTILVKMGRDEPAVTMDLNGKLIWARHSELCQG